MRTGNASDHPLAPKRPGWRLPLRLAALGILVVLALPALGYLFRMAIVLVAFQFPEGDEPIPLDQARPVLAKLLKSKHGVTLDPTAEVIEAHRTSGGFQGDGTNWYLVRLSAGQAARLEMEFRAGPGPTPREQSVKFVDPAVARVLGWDAGPPADARAYSFQDGEMTEVVFSRDWLYYQFSHY